jgi:hypothetical protein
MPVMKKLLVIAVLAVAAYAAYAYVVRPPEKRACARLAELCGLDARGGESERCQDMLDALKKSSAASSARVTTCLSEAKSCGEAAGCASGAALSAGAGFAKDFIDGLQKIAK